ncbi:hypothetical protein MKZ38_007816 [Zalerion maritima]|uniref:Rpr2-domain-containing protein n=1 Tax=Zalerion maritima TaxID=339359 RepID=A0AAD5WN33_9PEZI|nr:hypothetical protein MKZ38_007816 [Zalerion maritima]
MAKPKKHPKDKVPNRAQYARINYLYQAGTYLASISSSQSNQPPPHPPPANPPQNDENPQTEISTPDPPRIGGEQGKNSQGNGANLTGMSRRLFTEMRRVARKTQIRLDPSIKRTVCRYCDSLLFPTAPGAPSGTALPDTTPPQQDKTAMKSGPGSGSTSYIENKSKGSKKPWADVLVVECATCGGKKRYPVGAEQQRPRKARGGKEAREGKGRKEEKEEGEVYETDRMDVD